MSISTIFKKIFVFLQRPRVLFYSVVIIPFVISLAYFVVFSLSRYESTAQVVVKQLDDQVSSSLPALALLSGSNDPISQEYSLYLTAFITSNNMLSVLDKNMDWSAKYAGHLRDPLYYLPKDATLEEKLKFYNRIVHADFDSTTGILTIRAEAFSPEIAHETVQKIVTESQKFIDDISHQMAVEKIKIATKELQPATEQYQNARAALIAFQDEHQILDANAASQSVVGIVNTLQEQIVTEKTNLTILRRNLGRNAPQIQQAEGRLRALENQLTQEIKKSTMATAQGSKNNALNKMNARYQQLLVNAAVAEEFYKTSLSVMESSKYEAMKNSRILIPIVTPVLAQEAAYPRTIYNLITILIVLLFIYGVLRFVIASIKDHYE